MKKTIILVSLAAAFVFAACQKNQNPSAEGYTLSASIEQQAAGTQTKTYLDNKIVKWSEGDQILLYTDNETPEGLTMTLQGGAGTTSGRFYTDATPAGNPDCAIYPASAFSAYDGATKTFTFTLPATQNYVENSFDNGANVAVAKVNGKTMDFLNTCGVIKLQMEGFVVISSISIKGKKGEKLNGLFSADASSIDPSAQKVGDPTELEKVVTLDCGEKGAYCTKMKDFYIVVPAGSFSEGFTATITSKQGKETEFSTDEDNTISRSKIRVMPKIILQPEYIPVEFITWEGDGRTDSELCIELVQINQIDSLEYTFRTSWSSTNVSDVLLGNKYDQSGYIMYVQQSGDYGIEFRGGPNDSAWKNLLRNESWTGYGDDQYHTWKLSIPKNRDCTSVTKKLSIGGYNPAEYSKTKKIKNIVFFKDNVKIHDFIPAKCGGLVGMYDKITGTFTMNSGTGEFVAGPEITE